MASNQLSYKVEYFNHLNDGIVVYNLSGQFLYLNSRAAELFGSSAEDLIGEKGWEVCPDALSAAFYQACQRALSAQRNSEGTAQQTMVQLQEFSARLQTWFEVRIYPGSEQLIVSFQDISQYKQHEAALEAACEELEHRLIRQAVRLQKTEMSLFSESLQRKRAQAIADQTNAQLARVLESVTDAFCALDKNWRFSYVNRRAESIFGRSQAQLLGRSIWDIFPNSTGTRFHQACYQAQDTQTSVQVEEFAHALDRWLEYHIYPSVDGVSIYIQDITQRKQAEAEQHRLYEQAQESNKLKHEFLLTLSHELRTPLNAILGWANLMIQPKIQPEMIRRGAEIIDRKAKDLKQIVYDLLDVSQIMTGRLQLQASAIDLAQLVEETIQSLQFAADLKALHIEIHNEMPPTLTILGDAKRLRHIVWHLFSNAVKFTPNEGQIRVRLSQDSDWVRIEIADTGKGIAPDFLPYVFDDFRQADGSTTRTFGGLGLGLAMVRYLTEMHGGTIEIFSVGENQGTTAIVQLPLSSSNQLLA